MKKEIEHRGWDWTKVQEVAWTEAAPEFLPVALDWAQWYRTVIDIGAGRGRHALFLNRLGLDALAVDLSESAVDSIRARSAELGQSVTAVVGDMTALPAGDEAFDCAVVFHTIYHTGYRGVKAALDEIRRVLKPGGEVYLTFNAKDNPSFTRGIPVDEYTIYKEGGLEDHVPHTYLDMEDIETLMRAFVIIRAQKIQELTHNEKPVGGVHYFVRARKR